MGVRTANVQDGNIGETLTGLAEVIHGRRDASPQESYTARLLTDVEDELLKKLAEEASEVIMACKDNDHDHIRYEAGDLIYHLLVTLERYGITLDELAGELNARRHKVKPLVVVGGVLKRLVVWDGLCRRCQITRPITTMKSNLPTIRRF